MLSVIVPAFNEEQLLPATLAALRTAAVGTSCELIVVDNASTDSTRSVALSYDATVVTEPVRSIARVRNAGAGAAIGEVLAFVDADTLVPESLLHRIAAVMQSGDCVGGAVAVVYDAPRRAWMRWYLKGWAFWARFFNMKQGAAMFCRRDVFDVLGGYDESIYVGEDIEFYWRLTRYARRAGRTVHFIQDPKVRTSARRFDRMSIWKGLLLTHPVVIRLNWRRRSVWKDWYKAPPAT